MSKDESWVCIKIREELDKSGQGDIQIAIRPHPSNYEIYKKILRPGIITVPKEGILPNRPEELQLFFDSLYYSAAVVDGVNTSGIIDATIMDKPGIIVFTKEHKKTQLETQHFRQLIEGGVLYEVETFDEFPILLKKILDGKDDKKENRKKFVAKFIRPLGMDKMAGEAAADEIEKKPLVSIGLPTYNRAYCIRRAIDSLLNQTYRNFELIVSDNASTDDTENILREYAEKDTRVKYFRQPENKGYAANFYFTLAQGKGKYFIRVSDDDWWAREYIEKLVGTLEDNPEYGAAACSFHLVEHDGAFSEAILLTGECDTTHDGYFKTYKKVLERKPGLDHFTFGLFYADFLKKFLARPLTGRLGWDRILVSEMALAIKLYCVPEVLRFVSKKIPGKSHSARFHAKKKKFFVSTVYYALFTASIKRVLTSPVIPFHRKLFAFIPWSSAMFSKRRKFFGFIYGDAGRFFRREYWRRKLLGRV